MITLQDLEKVKLDLDTLKGGCLSPYKEIYFLKFVTLGQLDTKIYQYIAKHGTRECVNLIDEIKGAKDLKQTRPDLWNALKDTIFSP
jgi:hypothetical protein